MSTSVSVLERVLFYRERNDGLYRVITYQGLLFDPSSGSFVFMECFAVAKMIDEIVVSLVGSVAFGSIVYFATNIQCSFFVFWIVYFGTLMNGIGKIYLPT